MQLKQYIGYLHLYCFSEYVTKWYKEVKDLPEPILEVGLALRLENKERFWQMWLRDEMIRMMTGETVNHSRMV
jgi:hypothetical protein